MPRNGTSNYTNGLVDIDQGIISREIFANEDIYKEELQKVFARCWLFIGHEAQVPEPGDFFLSYMGAESVILTRDRNGTIRVFLNTCRHRGMRVCRYDEGNTKTFYCPYHGWSYATSGELVGVPFHSECYGDRLDRSKWGLIEVPKLVNFHGSIWACWDPDAPDFEEFLGDAAEFLKVFFTPPDTSDEPLEMFCGVQKWMIPCNWKWGAENFAGDNYHNISHSSVDKVKISPSGQEGRHTFDVVVHPSTRINVSVPKYGHSIRTKLYDDHFPYTSQYPDNPVAEAYFRDAHEKRRERLGDKARLFTEGGTIFPNMSFSNGRSSIAMWHPRGPHKTEVWRWYFIPRNAPEEVCDELRHYVFRYQGPSGLTEQDDMENWNYAHDSCIGEISRRFPFNYALGPVDEFDRSKAPWFAPSSKLGLGVSEHNQRGFYEAWAGMMDAM